MPALWRPSEGVRPARSDTLESGRGPQPRDAGGDGREPWRGAGSSPRPSADSLQLAEAYPDLKASRTFSTFRKTWSVPKVSCNPRRYYNAVVRDLNTLVETFPALLVARPTGFPLGTTFNRRRRPARGLNSSFETIGHERPSRNEALGRLVGLAVLGLSALVGAARKQAGRSATTASSSRSGPTA